MIHFNNQILGDWFLITLALWRRSLGVIIFTVMLCNLIGQSVWNNFKETRHGQSVIWIWPLWPRFLIRSTNLIESPVMWIQRWNFNLVECPIILANSIGSYEIKPQNIEFISSDLWIRMKWTSSVLNMFQRFGSIVTSNRIKCYFTRVIIYTTTCYLNPTCYPNPVTFLTLTVTVQ